MYGMAPLKGEKDLNAAIPEALWDDLDAISGGFRFYKKKHLVAAALTAFLRMTPRQQHDAITAAEQAYYRESIPSTTAEITASDTDGAVPGSHQAKPKPSDRKRR